MKITKKKRKETVHESADEGENQLSTVGESENWREENFKKIKEEKKSEREKTHCRTSRELRIYDNQEKCKGQKVAQNARLSERLEGQKFTFWPVLYMI